MEPQHDATSPLPSGRRRRRLHPAAGPPEDVHGRRQAERREASWAGASGGRGFGLATAIPLRTSSRSPEPMANARIVVTPGDGVGKEVTAAALTVLEAAQAKHGFHLDVRTVECGAQYYSKTGHEWEEGGLAACKEADAVLLGAVGWPGVSLPDGNIAGWNVIFGLRLGLDLYANVRPCRLYPGVPHKVSEKFTQIDRKSVV